MQSSSWYKLKDATTVNTPTLLVYPQRISSNISQMIAMAGGTERLRPHVKTHKTAEIIEMQLNKGIDKFKCATIAEAELLAMCNAPDILLAMQPVGANLKRFFDLENAYPKSKFSALVDNQDTLNTFSAMAASKGSVVSLWMDINCGMNRTGISPDAEAQTLYSQMNADRHIDACGFHVYDGHIRHQDIEARTKACDLAFNTVLKLKEQLISKGIQVANIVAGGSPTFPIHAKRKGIEVSPGTTLLWDVGYGDLFKEMNFLPAAVLLTRVISKPAEKTLCLDLGHKHLACEMPFPRVAFLNIDDVVQKGQSEEHFVVEAPNANDYRIGDAFYAVPVHICPTVAKYKHLQVVSKGEIIDRWRVAARNTQINI